MMIRKLLAGAAAAAVLGTGALAYALDTPSPPSLAAQVDDGTGATDEAPAGDARDRRAAFAHRVRRPGHGLFKKAIHGELVVPDGEDGWQEVVFDKGTVVSVNATNIVLRRDDDQTVELKLTDETNYKGVEGWEEIQTDENAVVVSRDGDAVGVGQRPEGALLHHRESRSGMVSGSEEQVPAT